MFTVLYQFRAAVCLHLNQTSIPGYPLDFWAKEYRTCHTFDLTLALEDSASNVAIKK